VGAESPGEQRLFRVEVSRSGALDPSFKLVLRLARADRFDLAASDPFGRALWRIGVDGSAGRFRDERRRSACRFDPVRPDALPRLDWGLAALDLPPLLLGRLPAAAASARPAPGDAGRYRDAEGREWSLLRDGPEVAEWTLHRSGGDLRYRRERSGASLEDERTRLLVHWRQMTAEPLAGPLEPLGRSPGDEPDCADVDLS